MRYCEIFRELLHSLKLYKRVNASLDWYMPKGGVSLLVRVADTIFRLTVPNYKREALRAYLASEKYQAERAEAETEHEP